MFCPNCGNNCGDARFCTACGTQLKGHNVQEQQPREMQKKAWVEGTPCPYCGGMQIEDGKCMFCGVQLQARSAQKADETYSVSYDIPCGFYQGITSSLTLREKECVVSTVPFLFKKYETRIPYDKITAMVYVRPGTRLGHILFRWEGNKNEKIPENNVFSADHTTVTISERDGLLFYHIFYMLKNVIPRSAKCSVRIPEVKLPGIDEQAARVDIDQCFQKYAPFRTLAVTDICKKTDMPAAVAIGIVDRAFDVRQEKLYTENPLLANRDLNLLIAERNHQEKMAAERRAQEREQNRRDEMLYRLDRLEREMREDHRD